MARPVRTAESAETSGKLLAVASAEFARRGFDGARLADIAEEVGIRRPSLLYHYPSKQDLYAAVIRQAFSDLGLALQSATDEKAPFQTRFDELVKRCVAFFDDRPDIATLILRELLDGHGPGQSLLLEAGVPILLRVEKFIREEGKNIARRELPIRQALLQVFSGILVQASAGPLREPLWGKLDKTRVLAKMLVFEEDK
jgi:AcrR family transcriptional regulator